MGIGSPFAIVCHSCRLRIEFSSKSTYMKNIPYKTLLIVTTVLPMALLNGLLLAQTETGSSDGVVTDTQNHPLAGVKVSLDDQEQGRTEFTTSDSVGRFHFPIASASTYMVRARKSGYLEGSQG